jgi:signal transduction histidine kinase
MNQRTLRFSETTVVPPSDSGGTGAFETQSVVNTLEQLRHADRLGTLGRLASTVAHELGTPLNIIGARATMIAAGEVTGEDVRENARIIAEQSTRMARILGEILTFSRRAPMTFTELDLSEVVEKAMTLASWLAKKDGPVKLQVSGSGGHVRGDAGKILQVLMNLILNGLQAMPAGGTLRVRLRTESCTPRGASVDTKQPYARIDVMDEGAGIPGKILPRVFEPFFTTKPATEGTGLGLAIAQGIALEHGGWIDVESKAGHGACFTVRLPRTAPHAV